VSGFTLHSTALRSLHFAFFKEVKAFEAIVEKADDEL
jgi:hypothetical protein